MGDDEHEQRTYVRAGGNSEQAPSELDSQPRVQETMHRGAQAAVTLYDRREQGLIEEQENEGGLTERREFPQTQRGCMLIDARKAL